MHMKNITCEQDLIPLVRTVMSIIHEKGKINYDDNVSKALSEVKLHYMGNNKHKLELNDNILQLHMNNKKATLWLDKGSTDGLRERLMFFIFSES